MNLRTHMLAATLLAGTASVALAAGAGTQSDTTGTQPQQQGQTTQYEAQATQSEVMKEENIREMLETRGYSDVGDFEVDGRSYVVEAKRYGENVELKIDPMTASIEEGQELSEDQVEQMLEDEGYENVSDVSRDGDTFSADAERDGDKVRVDVNRQYGVIVEEQERDGEG